MRSARPARRPQSKPAAAVSESPGPSEGAPHMTGDSDNGTATGVSFAVGHLLFSLR
jgi:hypothetical protein